MNLRRRIEATLAAHRACRSPREIAAVFAIVRAELLEALGHDHACAFVSGVKEICDCGAHAKLAELQRELALAGRGGS